MTAPPQRTLEVAARPILRAFEQIADQLRDHILTAGMNSGDRLPTEQQLASQFAVSRGTIREALRLLHSEGLIRSAQGVKGGTFVAAPTADNIIHFLTGSFSLLAGAAGVSVAEIMEARQLLEVPAARSAATNLDSFQLARLEETLTGLGGTGRHDGSLDAGRAFHIIVVAASPNRLLRLLTPPLFRTLQFRFERRHAPNGYWECIRHDHVEIFAAIADHEPELAAEAMSRHLHNIRPFYDTMDEIAGASSDG